MIKYIYLTTFVFFLLLTFFNGHCAEHRPARSEREQKIYSALETMPVALIDLVTQYVEITLEDVHSPSSRKPTATGDIFIRALMHPCTDLYDEDPRPFVVRPEIYAKISIEPHDTFTSIQEKVLQKGFEIDDKNFFLDARKVKSTQDLIGLLHKGTLWLLYKQQQ